MNKVIRMAFLVSLLFVFTGCAGKDFVRPSSDAFKLGQTTYIQVVQQMGEPRQVGDVLKNGKTVKSITYVYAQSNGEALEDGVIPARALVFYFHNDSLVGQEFVSSFKFDHSNFDETKIEKIIKGQTTRAEAIQLLGRPSASFIYPMVKETSGHAIGYGYSTTRKGAFSFKFFRKLLRISFDDRDHVADIEYSSSGNK